MNQTSWFDRDLRRIEGVSGRRSGQRTQPLGGGPCPSPPCLRLVGAEPVTHYLAHPVRFLVSDR